MGKRRAEIKQKKCCQNLAEREKRLAVGILAQEANSRREAMGNTPAIFEFKHRSRSMLYDCSGGATRSVKEVNNYKYHDDADGWENTQSALHEIVSFVTASYKRVPDPDFPENERVLGVKMSNDGWQTEFVPAPACPTLRGIPAGDVCWPLNKDFNDKFNLVHFDFEI